MKSNKISDILLRDCDRCDRQIRWSNMDGICYICKAKEVRSTNNKQCCYTINTKNSNPRHYYTERQCLNNAIKEKNYCAKHIRMGEKDESMGNV